MITTCPDDFMLLITVLHPEIKMITISPTPMCRMISPDNFTTFLPFWGVALFGLNVVMRLRFMTPSKSLGSEGFSLGGNEDYEIPTFSGVLVINLALLFFSMPQIGYRHSFSTIGNPSHFAGKYQEYWELSHFVSDMFKPSRGSENCWKKQLYLHFQINWNCSE